jgi:hypothetical protein
MNTRKKILVNAVAKTNATIFSQCCPSLASQALRQAVFKIEDMDCSTGRARYNSFLLG